jgi:peptidylprolyl isomerase
MRVLGLARVLAVLAALPAATRPPADDPVVAQRGTDRITLSLARAIVASLDADTRAALGTNQAMAGLLRDVLVQRAVLAQARAQKWDQRPDVAAAAQRARDVAVAQSFLAAQAAIPPGYPAEADIQAAYARNTARLMQPRSYHLAQVFVAAARGDARTARAELLAASGRLPRAHADLAEAARQVPGGAYSDLGWLAETQVAPAVRTMVSGLQEGAVGEPLCTPDGCHLVQLIATRPAGPAPLEAVRGALVRALRQQRRAQAEQAYADALLARQAIALNEVALAQLKPP